MIIVEGPDGAGKTTLLSDLAIHLGIKVRPRVVSKDAEAMVDLRDWVDNNLDEGFHPAIYDRHRLISETIYGPILRPQAEPGFSDLKWVGPRMKRFYELEPIIIYCLPPLEVVKANLAGDDDNKVVNPKIEQIYSAYVSRISLDETFAPGIVRVWDYTTTPRINDLPFWYKSVEQELKERTK